MNFYLSLNDWRKRSCLTRKFVTMNMHLVCDDSIKFKRQTDLNLLSNGATFQTNKQWKETCDFPNADRL